MVQIDGNKILLTKDEVAAIVGDRNDKPRVNIVSGNTTRSFTIEMTDRWYHPKKQTNEIVVREL